MAPHPGVAQLVERVVWDHEAAGSKPVTRTKKEGPIQADPLFLMGMPSEPAASCISMPPRESGCWIFLFLLKKTADATAG